MSKKVASLRAQCLLNAGLVLFSVIFVLVVIEIVLRVSVGSMPLGFRKYLPTDVKIIAQTAKDPLVPQSYVALIGDSYAAGWGDWYHRSLDEKFLGSPPFHSAHVIHDVSGLDVISFGRPAQGSFKGIAYFPLRDHKQLRSRGFPLPDPSIVVVYFYEGNDLNNNIRFLDQYWNGHDSMTSEDVGSLVETISANGFQNGDTGDIGDTIVSYFRNMQFIQSFYVAKFLYVLSRDLKTLLSRLGNPEPTNNQGHVRPAQAWIGDKKTEIFGPESPPVYLSEVQIDRAISLFESSLRYLMKHYNKSKLFIVYLPSPTMSYQLLSANIPVGALDGTVHEYPVAKVMSISDLVCQKIANVAVRLKAPFLDMRPPIRAASREKLVHGPHDWYHFNENGYRVLGSTVAHYLKAWFNGPPMGTSISPTGASSEAETDAVLTEPRCAQIAKYAGAESVQMLGSQTDRANWN